MTAMLGELFDPKADLLIRERIRPHWSQAGAIVFVTFRTVDSIPREVLQRWDREKNDWLERRNLLDGRHWSDVIPKLDARIRSEFDRRFNRCREAYLDTCAGQCLLRKPELASIVKEALLHFDGDRYRMGDFVIMPNHVHLLAAFSDPQAMEKQFDSWLHYTAYRIHQATGQKGHFWQQEPFDHIIRSVEQYEYLRHYIAENPRKAKLRANEYLYRAAE
jgi:putative transposase